MFMYGHISTHTYESPDHISLKSCFVQKEELLINEFLFQLSSLLPPYQVMPGKGCACHPYVQMRKEIQADIILWGGEGEGKDLSITHKGGERKVALGETP